MAVATPLRALLDTQARLGDVVALTDGGRRSISYAALPGLVDAIGVRLQLGGARSVGLLVRDRLDLHLLSTATLAQGLSLVPLPQFFHDDQLRNVLASGAVDAVLTDEPERLRELGVDVSAASRLDTWTVCPIPGAEPRSGEVVTFTSGTTGAPKGVRLRADDLLEVARSAARVARLVVGDRHLAILPPSILLEQVAGTLRTLVSGATLVVPSEGAWDPTQPFDAAALHAVAERVQPTSMILMPEHLSRWARFLRRTDRRGTPGLRFVGVGGARVEPVEISRARRLGLPVYQGYGLSEAASIVALNGPDDPGAPLDSVGRALPHVELRIDDCGEVHVRGTTLLGYLGDDGDRDPARDWWPTGDLGELSADGHLFLRGRRRDAFVTSFGRNVSSGWITDLLTAEPGVEEARVVGESLPAPVAAVATHLEPRRLRAAVARVNARLPAYARLACVTPLPPSATADDLLAAAERSAHRETSSPDGVATMSFHARLVRETEPLQRELLEIPFCRAAVEGDLSREEYIAFLTEAYHHVRHTVPLLMACGARLSSEREWLRTAVAEYIDEELGHEQWILADIAAAGGDADAVRRSRPGLACELLVSYAYDSIARGDPLAFFGMVHVLEGTSVLAATRAANALQSSLRLPAKAFTYLSSHGELDQDHVGFFAGLMDRLQTPAEQECVLHAARVFFRLYGDVFRGLEPRTLRVSDRVPVGAVAS